MKKEIEIAAENIAENIYLFTGEKTTVKVCPNVYYSFELEECNAIDIYNLYKNKKREVVMSDVYKKINYPKNITREQVIKIKKEYFENKEKYKINGRKEVTVYL